MSWFVVGGIAIGATAGAIAGSEKGGDDVWKGALLGGALGAAGGAGAGALAGGAGAAGTAGAAGVAGAEGAGIAGLGAAETAVAGGAGVGAAAPAGIIGAETAAAAAPAAVSAAAPTSAGILGAEGAAASSAIPGIGMNAAAPIAGTSSTAMPGAVSSAFAPGMQAPITMIEAPAAGGFGAPFAGTPGSFVGSNASFGTTGGANIVEGGGLLNEPAAAMGLNNAAPAASESITLKPGQSVTDALISARDAGNPAVTGGAPTLSPLEKGFQSALGWVQDNPMKAGLLGVGALSLTGLLNRDNNQTFGGPTEAPVGYTLSPDFKPVRVNPQQYRYRSSYAEGGLTDLDIGRREAYARAAAEPITMMAEGGIAGYARGGDTRRQLAMIDPRTQEVPAAPAPSYVGSAGIYSDDDADTRSQDALTAAQTRMAKTAKRANVRLGMMQKAKPIDELELEPVPLKEEKMASGGISSLGDYAAGGSPRLLRGPGDGMSDDIPASIADKQPARLADGEFVVPADVVSGLGNGSTEAGAKKLHKMMDKVRVDRTGTKKQGREIKAEKYMPGMAEGGIASYAEGGDVDLSQYYVYDAYGNQVPMSTLQSAVNQATAPSTPATTYQQQLVNPGQFAVGGQNTPDYRVPGATLTGNLGRWSNIAGEAERAARPASTNQLITQAYLNNLGRAPEQAGFNYWMDQAGAPTTQANFNEAAYLRANPDVAAAVERGQFGSGYEHYSQYGRNESRAGAGSNLPSVLENIANSAEARNVRYGNVSADPAAYLRANPDVAAAGVNPMQHYIDYGAAEGRNVRPAAGPAVTPPQINTRPTYNAPLAFDPSFYLRQNPDVAAAGVDPMQHYIEYGRREGRLPYQNYQQATQAALAQAQAAQGQAPAAEAAPAAAEAKRRGGILAAKK